MFRDANGNGCGEGRAIHFRPKSRQIEEKELRAFFRGNFQACCI